MLQMWKTMEDQNSELKEQLPNIDQNIESILAFYKREEQKLTRSQRIIEYLGDLIGSPLFLGLTCLFAVCWMLGNYLAKKIGWPQLDPPPFFFLQGLVTFCALLITTIVLIKQNRLTKFEEQRQNLELQVNLITEQKTTKLIKLIEELRRDLPMVADRDDPEVEAFKHPTNPDHVLHVLYERRGTSGKIGK